MNEVYRTVYLRPYLKGAGPSFRLRIGDVAFRNGRDRISYTLEISGDDGRPPYSLLFEGNDFGPSPLHAIDSDDAVASLLGFLALRPGDTDSEYFDDYTPEQIEYTEQHAEALNLAAGNRFGFDR